MPSLASGKSFHTVLGETRGFRAALVMSTILAGCGALAMTATPAKAADTDQLENQINTLQYQVDQLRAMQEDEQAKMKAAIGTNKPAVPYVTGGNRFGLSSADGKNTIELTGRLHFDAGDYFSQTPADKTSSGPATTSHELASGINARRARIGVTGKLAGDFAYTLIYDFGNSQDTGGGSSPLTGVAYQAGIENAYITYNGFNNVNNLVPIAFDVGYLDLPITLDEATSSNDIMFMERDSSQIVAVTNTGGGDYRSAAGIRSYKPDYWTGLYLTGPTSGTNHTGAGTTSATTGAGAGTTNAGAFGNEAYGVGGRATYQFLTGPDYSLHAGLNVLYSVPQRGNGGASPSIALSDRPQLRVDPTSTLTVTVPDNSATVGGAELAGAYGPFFFQGEYYRYEIVQYRGAGVIGPLPTLGFNGGYVEASYSIGGTRHYNPSTGAYTAVIPTVPFSMANGGGGAWELAARFGAINLNTDLPGGGHLFNTTGGVSGGDQKSYALGVNWYPSTNLRFMLDYTRTDVDDRWVAGALAGSQQVNDGVHVNALGARAQFSF
jgi:phosphate-selective porin OprO/OprP